MTLNPTFTLTLTLTLTLHQAAAKKSEKCLSTSQQDMFTQLVQMGYHGDHVLLGLKRASTVGGIVEWISKYEHSTGTSTI